MEKEEKSLRSYFTAQWKPLAVVTVSGIIYNVGMAAGPWFEGQLAQCLLNILEKKTTYFTMVRLALGYVLTIFLVQFMRYLKRLYVRKFANRTILTLRSQLYYALLTGQKQTDIGDVMTKALSDADDCAEGMRKFTTEIFDTGVVMVVYLCMLFAYDWRLTLLVLIFPPLAYVLAAGLKKPVTTSVANAKKATGELNKATLDRTQNALTYRIFGVEDSQNHHYERYLKNYEQKQIKAGVLINVAEPLYYIVSSISFILIIYLGGKNVLGQGWQAWNLAAFSTYLACFGKLAVKSSHAANLFNAVQKAEVSWHRIKPLLNQEAAPAKQVAKSGDLQIKDLAFSWDQKPLLQKVSLTAKPGQIVGITGPVACGKSTLGRIFLEKIPYKGSASLGGQEVKDLLDKVILCSYQGHQPQLFSASIADNITLGQKGDLTLGQVLGDADLTPDLKEMPNGADTEVGDRAQLLSGGQAARVALARALYFKRPLLVLDDPFASVDEDTAQHILAALKANYQDRITLLISHRLEFFPQLDSVLYLDGDQTRFGTHAELIAESPGYRKLFEGGEPNAK
ncbi:ABC transporter ATP-binding protein [Lactobacillus equicursoris]|uniref:ABC transporter ATP-binding protein n=1 Tax=Lactobacillus equicursoris TaxID=420645 RepID=A0A844FP43_9LACO|nr:ABC transporter ATP-binding protein [Lactobacillus equicursoris]MST80404.1 ABC transporter ATP-binding protein [Lactobacillus equicursoris]